MSHKLPGVQVRNADFRQQMVHKISLCYKDLILCHFVVSSTSVKCARVVNWKIVFNMSKFISNKEHSRAALVFDFHLKKTVAESY